MASYGYQHRAPSAPRTRYDFSDADEDYYMGSRSSRRDHNVYDDRGRVMGSRSQAVYPLAIAL